LPAYPRKLLVFDRFGSAHRDDLERIQEHGSGLGRWRWVVERTFAWLHNYRRLRIRWERDPIVHMAFLTLACAFICWRYLLRF
jgi:transposase